MKSPKPWYRSDRDAWFVQHQGRQIQLAKGKSSKAEAQAAFFKLMAGMKPANDNELLTAVLCDLFLDFSQANHSQAAYQNYKYFLVAFCKVHGRLKATDVKPFHVTRWVDGKKKWNGAKRHGIITETGLLVGGRAGLIELNPLRRLKAPRVNRRERVLTADERTQILGAIRDKPFQRFVTALLGTGCRPSEVAKVTAQHVNLELGVWVFQKHKTAKKTGKPRVVYLSPEMLRLTKEQIARHPTGPLFPSQRGVAFTQNAWRCRFRRLRDKFPNLQGVVAYCCRHSFATDALINGVGAAQVATLLGHCDTSMLATYSHIAQNLSHMREAAARAAG